MRKLTYTIEATENECRESLTLMEKTVTKVWKRTDTGMRCDTPDFCEQLENAGIDDEDLLYEISENLDDSFLGTDLPDLLR